MELNLSFTPVHLLTFSSMLFYFHITLTHFDHTTHTHTHTQFKAFLKFPYIFHSVDLLNPAGLRGTSGGSPRPAV